jgi:hypothetical protein
VLTSSIVSQTKGARSFDHTGRDFGFTNLAARHTTRFFRDSTLVADVDYANVPRNSVITASGPGNADNAFSESPSFHKVHRNNLQRAEISTILEPQYSGQDLNNSQKVTYNTAVTASSMINKDPTFSTEILDIITDDTSSNPAATNEIAFSMWAQIDEPASNGVRRNLVSIGKVNAGIEFLRFGITKGTPTTFSFDIATTNGVSPTQASWTAAIDTATAYSSGPNHIVASFYGESGSLSSNSGVDFWFNGTQLVTTSSTSPKDFYDIDFQTSTYTFRGTPVNRNGQGVITFGGESKQQYTGGAAEFSGSIDQITVWKRSHI